MKTNEIVICKQTFYNSILKRISFTKNKSYKIDLIDKYYIWIDDDEYWSEYMFLSDKSDRNFSDYFYNKEEIRLLKLNSL